MVAGMRTWMVFNQQRAMRRLYEYSVPNISFFCRKFRMVLVAHDVQLVTKWMPLVSSLKMPL